MSKKNTANLTPGDIIAMPLAEFEKRFGFRPVDALEKHYFAGNAKRLHIAVLSQSEPVEELIDALQTIERDLNLLHKIVDDAHYWLERDDAHTALTILKAYKE